MKKHLRGLPVCAGTLTAILLFAAAACDNGTDPAPGEPDTFIGVWEMTTIVMYDTPVGELTMPANKFLESSGTGATNSVLEFREDGSAAVATTYADSSQDTIPGTWTVNGDQLMVAGAGIDDTVQFKATGNSLVLTRTMAINFVPEGPKQDIVVDMKYTRIE